MPTYISLLRGINVTGHRKISMQELRECYASLGFSQVVSYIQSGNVIFTSTDKSTKILQEKIQAGIAKEFGYDDVTVFVFTPKQLQYYIANNPFLKDKTVDVKRLHITFLSKKPLPHFIASLEKYKSEADQFLVQDNIIYLYCPNGYGRTKLSNNFFESKLKLKATTRNWNSANKLLSLANNI